MIGLSSLFPRLSKAGKEFHSLDYGSIIAIVSNAKKLMIMVPVTRSSIFCRPGSLGMENCLSSRKGVSMVGMLIKV